MFDRLARDIRELDIPLDGAALAEVIALHDELAARTSQAVGEFDAAGMWDVAGEGSMKRWLMSHAHLGERAAARISRTAQRLRRLPVTAAAWRDGSLSSGQIDAVMTIVRDHHVDLFAEHESQVVPALAPLDVADTKVVLNDWAQKAESVDPTPLRDEDNRELFLSRLENGERVLRGHLDADAGVLLETALRVMATKDDPDEPRTAPRRTAPPTASSTSRSTSSTTRPAAPEEATAPT